MALLYKRGVVFTCDLVSDELARLHLPYGREERADLLLRHGLRQVVDDQVGLRVLAPAAPVLLAAATLHSVHEVG